MEFATAKTTAYIIVAIVIDNQKRGHTDIIQKHTYTHIMYNLVCKKQRKNHSNNNNNNNRVTDVVVSLW